MRKGDQVPDFEATLDDGRTLQFSQLLQAGPAVVFFYPKAFTPGCTAESCHFRDLAADFAEVGAQRIGVSRDGVSAQSRFRAEHALDFPLISDRDGEIARIFDVKRMGRLPSKRQTFVVDVDRTCLAVISSEMNMELHADEALAVLRSAATVSGLSVEVSADEPARAGD